MITLRQLKYFEALARVGHFGRAAEECAVSQPALSMQIQELEATLGVGLVERKRGHVELTVEGAEVLDRARKVLNDVGDIVEFAQQSGEGLGGSMRFGVIPTIAPYVLPHLLPAVRQTYPGLALHVRETQTDNLLSELVQGRQDLLLLALPVEVKDIETLALFEDRFLLAVPSEPVIYEDGRITQADLVDEELLLLEEGHCLRSQALDFCSLVRPEVMQNFGATSLSTLMQMVANGYGVTMLPELCRATEVHDPRIRLVRFAEPAPRRLIGLAWRNGSPRAEAFAEFGTLISEVCNTSLEQATNGAA